MSKTRALFEKTQLGKLVGLKISDGVVVKGVTLTQLKRHKRFRLFNLWILTETREVLASDRMAQEGTRKDKVLISEPPTYFIADHMNTFIFK